MTLPTTIDRTTELEGKVDQLTEQVTFLTEQIALLVKERTDQRRRRGAMQELLADAAPIMSQGVELAIARAGELEERGYIEFAAAGVGVVDRIVTNFTPEEVEALGDNVVQMVGIVKDLTQPEMLAVVDRLLEVVQRQARAAELEPEKPPSLISLAGKMRDPEIRIGLARALNTFKAVSASETNVAHDIIDTDELETKPDDTIGGT
jgi:uncharacterized protein YjgD (DUF1641 family)